MKTATFLIAMVMAIAPMASTARADLSWTPFPPLQVIAPYDFKMINISLERSTRNPKLINVIATFKNRGSVTAQGGLWTRVRVQMPGPGAPVYEYNAFVPGSFPPGSTVERGVGSVPFYPDLDLGPGAQVRVTVTLDSPFDDYWEIREDNNERTEDITYRDGDF